MIGARLESLRIEWNSQAILTPAQKFQKRLLNRFGAYCRTVWKNSIKRASRPGQHSSPGEPPLHHGTPILGAGQGYKGTIFFATDVSRKETSIGPVLLNGTLAQIAAGGKPMPRTLEEGGTTVIFRGTRRARRRVVATFRARPSKGAAFQKAIDKKLPELIAGGIMREV